MKNTKNYKILTIKWLAAFCLTLIWLAGGKGSFADPIEVATATSEYQVHLDHIEKSWHETPGKVSLISALADEAQLAAGHAGYAVTDLEDLDNIKLHISHVATVVGADSSSNSYSVAVLYAAKMAEENPGPSRGFGVARAAMAIADHMSYARDSSDATDSVKLHSEHVITSANNIVEWSNRIIKMSDQVVAGASPIVMAYYAEKIVIRLQWILTGHDADGDGKISWAEGEGGLAQINQHLSFVETES